eukprot:gb/GECG01002354.1/.p1 GENE.gb/GECG01002354.1/~~gb/GECG01002354.1/.p1  ORF type:complete len:879 (+),score=101.15 gb/GECG01002354.1/:1-2637(+)
MDELRHGSDPEVGADVQDVPWLGSMDDRSSVLSDSDEDYQQQQQGIPAASMPDSGRSMFQSEMTQQLIRAVLNNNVAEIGGLVNLIGVDVDTVTEEEGETALAVAAFYGRMDALKKLLELGADVNHQDARLGKTPVMKAAMRGFVGIVEQLIENNAQLGIKDDDGRTALHDAALYGETTVIQVLVQKGADVNAADPLGKTAVFHCCRLGNLGTLKFLVDEMKANVHARDVYGNTALIEASMWGRDEPMLRWLVRHARIDVNGQDNIGYFALTKAASCGHLETIRVLVSLGARANWTTNDGRTALMCAAERDQEDAVHRLVTRYDADVNITDELGETALIKACSLGRINMVDLLLSLGADTEVRSGFGQTALHVAASRGYVDIVRALLRRHANVSARDDTGSTALILASECGSIETIGELVLYNASLEDKTEEGYTALARVVASSMEVASKCRAITALIKAGADPLTKVGNETILDLAERMLTDTKALNVFLTACQELASAVHHEGCYFNSMELYAEAFGKFEDACTLDPLLVPCYIDKITCLLRLGKRKQAERCLQSAREIRTHINWQSAEVSVFQRKQILRLLRSDCRKLLGGFARLEALRPAVTSSMLSDEESDIQSNVVRVFSYQSPSLSNTSQQDSFIRNCLERVDSMLQLYQIGHEMENATVDDGLGTYWDSTLHNVENTTVFNDHFVACIHFLSSTLSYDFLNKSYNAMTASDAADNESPFVSLQSAVMAELCEELLQCNIILKGFPVTDQQLNLSTFTALDNPQLHQVCTKCSVQLARLDGNHWGHLESSRGILGQLRSICRRHTTEIIEALSLSSAFELSEFICRGIIDAAKVVVTIMNGYVGYRQNDHWTVWEIVQTLYMGLEYDDFTT